LHLLAPFSTIKISNIFRLIVDISAASSGAARCRRLENDRKGQCLPLKALPSLPGLAFH